MSHIIWLDPNLETFENKAYIHQLETFYFQKLNLFKKVDEAIDYIKGIRFEEIKLIISGWLYSEFIEKFKQDLLYMYSTPKIIVFTGSKEKFIEYNKEYENNVFYNYGGIAINIEEIKKFLHIGNENSMNSSSIFSTQIMNSSSVNTNQNEVKILNPINAILASTQVESKKLEKQDKIQLTFEYIDCIEKLQLPMQFKGIIDKISAENIDKFSFTIYEKYSKESFEVKKLLGQIYKMRNVPIEILCRYYARLLTIESDFYKDLNKNLRLNEKEEYLPFIKTLYEGVKLKALPLSSDKILYRGSLLSNDEIDKIKIYQNEKIKDLPSCIVFSKSFLSFSKDIKEAKKFLRSSEKSEKLSKVLFILENDDEISYNLFHQHFLI